MHKASRKVPLLLQNSRFDLNPDNESRLPMNEKCNNVSQVVLLRIKCLMCYNFVLLMLSMELSNSTVDQR